MGHSLSWTNLSDLRYHDGRRIWDPSGATSWRCYPHCHLKVPTCHERKPTHASSSSLVVDFFVSTFGVFFWRHQGFDLPFTSHPIYQQWFWFTRSEQTYRIDFLNSIPMPNHLSGFYRRTMTSNRSKLKTKTSTGVAVTTQVLLVRFWHPSVPPSEREALLRARTKQRKLKERAAENHHPWFRKCWFVLSIVYQKVWWLNFYDILCCIVLNGCCPFLWFYIHLVVWKWCAETVYPIEKNRDQRLKVILLETVPTNPETLVVILGSLMVVRPITYLDMSDEVTTKRLYKHSDSWGKWYDAPDGAVAKRLLIDVLRGLDDLIRAYSCQGINHLRQWATSETPKVGGAGGFMLAKSGTCPTNKQEMMNTLTSQTTISHWKIEAKVSHCHTACTGQVLKQHKMDGVCVPNV